MFEFSRDDVRQSELMPTSSDLHYSSSLCVQYSTGAEQVCLDVQHWGYYDSSVLVHVLQFQCTSKHLHLLMKFLSNTVPHAFIFIIGFICK